MDIKCVAHGVPSCIHVIWVEKKTAKNNVGQNVYIVTFQENAFGSVFKM